MDEISEAVRILKAGGLVAFPTETVYGLGADATSGAAVRRIFAAKGRPATNPIIVHVADSATARRYAGAWPELAQRLADRFWPGPLTLVVPRSPTIAPETSAGRDTVGLRAPDHPLAQQLLRAFAGPIAAPSANRSTRVSPTTAEHVREELGDSVDLILDGGPCRVGIESTVLDVTGDVPTILRPGGVSREQIEQVIGPVNMFTGSVDPTKSAASPGQHAIHYAPATPTYRFEREEAAAVMSRVRQKANRVVVLSCQNIASNVGDAVRVQAMPSEPSGYAKQIYAILREVDRQAPAAILIEMPPDTSEWAAVRDRLKRASQLVADFLLVV